MAQKPFSIKSRHLPFDEIIRKKINEDTLPIFMNGMHDEMQAIYKESQPLVPVDTGLTKSSGYVATPRFEKKGRGLTNIIVELFYGGVAIPYARTIYFNLDKQVFRNGKQSHWVHPSWNKRRNTMGGRLASRFLSRVKRIKS